MRRLAVAVGRISFRARRDKAVVEFILFPPRKKFRFYRKSPKGLKEKVYSSPFFKSTRQDGER
jgi:hypothetical protein